MRESEMQIAFPVLAINLPQHLEEFGIPAGQHVGLDQLHHLRSSLQTDLAVHYTVAIHGHEDYCFEFLE